MGHLTTGDWFIFGIAAWTAVLALTKLMAARRARLVAEFRAQAEAETRERKRAERQAKQRAAGKKAA